MIYISFGEKLLYHFLILLTDFHGRSLAWIQNKYKLIFKNMLMIYEFSFKLLQFYI